MELDKKFALTTQNVLVVNVSVMTLSIVTMAVMKLTAHANSGLGQIEIAMRTWTVPMGKTKLDVTV